MCATSWSQFQTFGGFPYTDAVQPASDAAKMGILNIIELYDGHLGSWNLQSLISWGDEHPFTLYFDVEDSLGFDP